MPRDDPGLGLSSGSFFRPDGPRAEALDMRMRAELADSLDHIREQAGRQWTDTGLVSAAERLREPIALLRGAERVNPALFSAYYRLVPQLVGDEGDPARAIEDLLAAAQPRPALGFRQFRADSLGGARMLSLYRQALDTDSHQAFVFLPPEDNAAQRTRESILRALALMQKPAPALADEIRGLVTEVVLAASSGALRFDGASSYQLWGALAVNVDEQKTDLEMLEMLAHEAGHSLLFGMTIDEPLVYNSDDELYRSPLRPDPRPMDGIYHATWVSARMHYALQSVHASGVLDRDQATECEGYLQASRRAFEDGDTAVRAHGDLSATGQDLMAGARAFMAQSAPNET